MSVVALEAVVEKGAIRLDALRTVPDQTKVFVVIPATEPGLPEPDTSTEETIPNAKMESVLELIQRLKHLALNPGQEEINIADFAGLGAEMWSSIDVDAYIEEERNSWERSLTE